MPAEPTTTGLGRYRLPTTEYQLPFPTATRPVVGGPAAIPALPSMIAFPAPPSKPTETGAPVDLVRARVRWLTEDQVRILVVDVSHLRHASDVIAVLESAKQPPGVVKPVSIYSLADVTGAVFTTAVVRTARELIEHNRPYVRAGAVVGLSPLQRAVYDIIVRRTRRGNLHPFDTLPDAVRWLKEQA